MASTESSSASSVYNSVKSTLLTTEASLEKGLSVLSNKYVNTALIVLLVGYLPYAVPSIGKSMVGILNNYAVKFIYVFVLAYVLSKSVKVATLTSLIIVLGILILKNLSHSEPLDNVSNQEEQPKKKGLLDDLLGLSADTLKNTNRLVTNLGVSKQGSEEILSQIKRYTPDQEQKSKPEVEVAKAVAKAQEVAVAQAEAHAGALEEIKAVSQPLSDNNTCGSRAPTEVTGFDENKSEYSDVNFSKSSDFMC